jgi:hypothetical protein
MSDYSAIRTLTIEIQGGLGNQLFQVFTLIATSLDNKIPFFFMHIDRPSRSDRPFYWNTIFCEIAKFIKKDLRVKYVYKEPHFHFKPVPISCDSYLNLALYGYFQSPKYFDHHKHSIIKLLKLKDKQQSVIKKFDDGFFGHCVSVHFRIGDYVKVQHIHPVLGLSYYTKSIQKLIDDTGENDWQVLYFYETQNQDIIDNHIKQLRQEFPMCQFVGIRSDLSDWEQLLAMSLCKHNIIANSTFSWWGAYLNEKKGSYVYYPEKWFAEGSCNRTDDLFPCQWKQVSFQ